mmetsp:Transcript_19394/g.24005  ORF Transcript_19394/g.24005 Transcript_19394/m.24005 type:complete len:89 (-) Transcript_19394:31-297(-)
MQSSEDAAVEVRVTVMVSAREEERLPSWIGLGPAPTGGQYWVTDARVGVTVTVMRKISPRRRLFLRVSLLAMSVLDELRCAFYEFYGV